MSWRCFHCDVVFKSRNDARDHFGPTELSIPGCKIDLREYRSMEKIHLRHMDEDTDLHRTIHRISCQATIDKMREEEKGYERGIRDGMALRKESE